MFIKTAYTSGLPWGDGLFCTQVLLDYPLRKKCKTRTTSWLNSQPLSSNLQKPWIMTLRHSRFVFVLPRDVISAMGKVKWWLKATFGWRLAAGRFACRLIAAGSTVAWRRLGRSDDRDRGRRLRRDYELCTERSLHEIRIMLTQAAQNCCIIESLVRLKLKNTGVLFLFSGKPTSFPVSQPAGCFVALQSSPNLTVIDVWGSISQRHICEQLFIWPFGACNTRWLGEIFVSSGRYTFGHLNAKG